jgi:hypothetical protein
MLVAMNERKTRDELQHLLVAPTIAAGHAEELRARAEDYASVLPEDMTRNLGALVDELCDLRDAIHDAGVDSHDAAARPAATALAMNALPPDW